MTIEETISSFQTSYGNAFPATITAFVTNVERNPNNKLPH